MDDCIIKLETECKEVKNFKNSLFSKIKSWYETDCKDIDVKEFGELIDVIKDLAEMDAKCWEAEYYKSIVKAMSCRGVRMGYPIGDVVTGYGPNVYPEMSGYSGGENNGNGETGSYSRYSPFGGWSAGTGTVGSQLYGYFYGDGTGRPDDRSGDGFSYREGRGLNEDDIQYGRSFSKYRDAKRHYTETKKEDDKEEMDFHAQDHLSKTILTMKEIWKHADPNMKKRMKEDLTKLINEMNV